MNSLSVALIGAGYWGSILKRYIEQNPKFLLVEVCDSKSNLQEIWDDKAIEAVVVATPNETHYDICYQAIWYGGKHVLCEKPLALMEGDCKILKILSEERKVKLHIEYTYTFSKALQLIVWLISEGRIGKLLSMELIDRHLGRFGGGSVYWLLGSHMLSILNMFYPLKQLQFSLRSFYPMMLNIDEAETGRIDFWARGSDWFNGHIILSLNYPMKETRVIFYGANGTIIYNPRIPSSIEMTVYERKPWTVAEKLPTETRGYLVDEKNNLRYALESFYNVVKRKEESNVDTAVEITRILEELQR